MQLNALYYIGMKYINNFIIITKNICLRLINLTLTKNIKYNVLSYIKINTYQLKPLWG